MKRSTCVMAVTSHEVAIKVRNFLRKKGLEKLEIGSFYLERLIQET